MKVGKIWTATGKGGKLPRYSTSTEPTFCIVHPEQSIWHGFNCRPENDLSDHISIPQSALMVQCCLSRR